MNEIIDRLINLAKNYKNQNDELGEEFLYKGNKEELDNWIKQKNILDIKAETVYEVIESIGDLF